MCIRPDMSHSTVVVLGLLYVNCVYLCFELTLQLAVLVLIHCSGILLSATRFLSNEVKPRI